MSVRRKLPGKSESGDLSRDNLSREIGRAALFLLAVPEVSIESRDESSVGRWSLEVLSAISVFRNRDTGIRSTNQKYQLYKAQYSL